jgi:beta-lactamase regulating signal transducer with metallopeptidase domain/protocatechuate 3,4-dioxygenase beta subunit
MFNLSLQWLVVAIDVSLKALLLAGTAALVLRLPRLGDSNLRHRVWMGVLIGMLLLPALSQTVPALQLPLAVPDAWTIAAGEPAPPLTQLAASEPSTTVDASSTRIPAEFSQEPFADFRVNDEFLGGLGPYASSELEFDAEFAAAAPVSGPLDTSSLNSAVLGTGEPASVPATGESPAANIRLSRWPIALLGLWLAGTCVMALRLLAGLVYSLRLVRCSTAITPAELTELGVDPFAIEGEGRSTPIAECPLIRVPLALGIVRPRVLLPSDWPAWPADKLQAVIAHERTHIERGDGAVIFLAEVNRCLYWFHPLAWWLRTHLGRLAETACDDAAIDATGDRTTYARHLLEVAAAVSGRQGRLVSPGISMARQSNVETRINTILDLTRPLSKRLTWTTTLLLAAALIPLITLAAAVRPMTGDASVDPPEAPAAVSTGKSAAPAANADDSPDAPIFLAAASDESEAAAEKPPVGSPPNEPPPTESTDDDSQPLSVEGVVLDPDGEPVSGATVRIVNGRRSRWYAAPSVSTVLATLTTPQNGRFQFTVPRNILNDRSNDRYHSQPWIGVLATVPGYGFGYAEIPQVEDKGPIKVHLAPPQEIRGRLVDLEGRPIAGATVRVFDVVFSESSEKVDEWLAALPEAASHADDHMYYGMLPPLLKGLRFPGYGNRTLSPELFPQLKTDADGRFELGGLGRDRVAVLQVTAPGFTQSMVEVLTRPLERPVRAMTVVGFLGNTKLVHGADFTYVAAPSAPVTGVVRDLDSGEPIVGAHVTVNSLAGTTWSHEGYIVTTTDAVGRYRLDGLPLGEGNRLKVVADGQPYLVTENLPVPVSRELQPVERDIELPRAVWATGRLFDEATGEPVQGTIHFTPFHGNELAERYPQYADRITSMLGNGRDYATDADGRFRIPVTPGRGLLCAKSDSDAYRTGYGVDDIEELAPFLKDANVGDSPTFDHALPSLFHSLREINPPADADEVTVDLPVQRGLSLELVFTDPAGEPLTGVSVGGVKTQPSSSDAPSDHVTAVGLTAGEATTVQARHRERNLGARVDIVPERDGGPLTIVLHPPTLIRGRLIDPQGEPLTLTSVEPRSRNAAGWLNVLAAVSTDDDGAFTVELLPGDTYDLIAQAERYAPLTRDLEAKPGQTIDLGDLVIDPDAQQWTPAVPKREPIITEPPPPAKPASKSRDVSTDPETRVSNVDQKAATDSTGDDRHPKGESTSVPLSYSGHVTNADGEPIAGAQLWLAVTSYERDVEGMLRALTTTDDDGRFQFVLETATAQQLKGRFPFDRPQLVATADRFGLDWLPLDVFEDDAAPSEKWVTLQARIDQSLGAGRFAGRTLKLRTEVRPIRGRLVDLDGHPLPNVRVLVEELSQPDIALLLKAFEESSKEGVYAALRATGMGVGGLARTQLQQLIPPVTTDGNGEFVVRGIGTDQLVTLTFDAQHIEARTLYVLGRDLDTVSLPHIPMHRNGAQDVYAGRQFTYAIGPSIPVEGIVKDLDTGEPVANTLVYVERLFKRESFNEQVQVQLRLDTNHMRAVTDDQGRFRVTGMPPGESHVLEAMPPKSEPYLIASQDVSLSLDDGDAKQIEIQVKQGIWIKGRVTDKQSGEPVSATVDYLALQKNPHTLDKLGLRQAWVQQRYRTDSDGRYRVLGLPGPGVLLVTSQTGKTYPKAVGAESVDGYREKNRYIPTTPIGLPVSNWHLIKQIDPAPNATSFTCDLVLDAGQSVSGRVVGPDGGPVSEISVFGEVIGEWFWTPRPWDKARKSSRFTVYSYDVQRPRQLFFKNSDETLVGQYRLEGKAPEEIVVTLEPAVRVTGRLIENETDLPAARYGLYCEKTALGEFRIDDCRTNDEGRFEINGLIAGLVYEMNAYNERHFTNNRNRFQIDLTAANPGDIFDLGDVTGPKSSRPGTKPERSGETDASSHSTPSPSGPRHSSDNHSATDGPGHAHSETSICAGTVVDANGQPVAGAHVAVIAMGVRPARGGDLTPSGDVLADGLTDANGGFRLVLHDVSGTSHRYANVVARMEGAAMAWEKLNLHAPRTDVSLQLRTEESIRGRLIDIDGQPAGGVRLFVRGMMKRMDVSPPTEATEGVGYHGGEEAPAAWVPAVTSDEQGRFTIGGVPAGFGVHVDVTGSERFAPQNIALNTGMPEHRGERDATYRPLVKNVAPGEEAVLVLSPAQLFEGVIRYEDTGEPAPHARLIMRASQQEQGGSMLAVAGKADASGHYQISPYPGVRFRIIAYPPAGVPYLARETPFGKEIRWQATDRIKQVDVSLPRGVLVRGRVVEAGTGAPVAGASVQYIPESVNNDFDSDEILTGWQGIQLSEADGRFEIAVLPGPGRLLAHGPDGTYVLKAIGDRELSSNRPGGRRRYVHAIERINPPADTEVVPVTLELQPGATVSGRLVDERGAPIDEAVVISRLRVSPHDIFWRGGALAPTLGGRFELAGLDADQEYPIHFLDAKNRRGATAVISATDKEPTIVLEECGQATMRFVDAGGRPVDDYYPSVEIVVTPGVYRFDSDAMQSGTLAADSDLIQNVDRINYPSLLKSDEKGQVLLPALIPGANYRLVLRRRDDAEITKDFQVESRETLDLGDLIVEPPE